MYKYIFQGIENIAIWPIIALIIFLTIFILGVVYAFTADKKHIKYMENLPLENEENEGIIN